MDGLDEHGYKQIAKKLELLKVPFLSLFAVHRPKERNASINVNLESRKLERCSLLNLELGSPLEEHALAPMRCSVSSCVTVSAWQMS